MELRTTVRNKKKCMILTLRQFLILVHCTKLKKSYDINTKIMHTKIIRTLTYLTTSVNQTNRFGDFDVATTLDHQGFGFAEPFGFVIT